MIKVMMIHYVTSYVRAGKYDGMMDDDVMMSCTRVCDYDGYYCDDDERKEGRTNSYYDVIGGVMRADAGAMLNGNYDKC